MFSETIFWVIFSAFLFWALYEKWDAKRKDYIDHPRITFWYFIFASSAIAFIHIQVLNLLIFDLIPILSTMLVISFTYVLFLILPKIKNITKVDLRVDHHYWKSLDKNYLAPKFAEVFFQQIFFGSVFLLLFENQSISHPWVIFITGATFVLAHIPLFVLQGKKIGTFYLLWSVVGAPLFVYVLLATNSLWYTISLHMLFYTILSFFYWIRSEKSSV
jgi:hypothetical protein